MHWISEKFIEDCVAEAPAIFLGRPLQLKLQQGRFGGFIPDLVFIDDAGITVIVEVQKYALDRNHLYKCLEYRDLLIAHEKGPRPIVALVCEEFPPRYHAIAATHGIEVHVFDRAQIINKAVASCPKSLRAHLLKNEMHEPDSAMFAKPPEFKRYGWKPHDTLADVYKFACRELSDEHWKKLERDNYGIILEAESVLEARDLFDDILNPAHWRIDSLKSKPRGWAPPHLEKLTRIRKPKAILYMFVTSKGNLSVRWLPKGSSEFSDTPHDWVRAPSAEAYAYERPANEILFIRNIYDLSTNPSYSSYHAHGDEIAALNTILLALVWATIQHIQKILSATVDVEVITEFQLTTGGAFGSLGFFECQDITGWRIISVEDLRIEEATQRISAFPSKTKIDIDVVLKTFAEESKLQNVEPKHLAKALRKKGHDIKAPDVQQLLNDFELVKYPAFVTLRTGKK